MITKDMEHEVKAFTPNRLRHMKVLVVGLARTGIAACKVLRRLGSVVKATDAKPATQLQPLVGELEDMGVAMQLGGHAIDFAQDCDLIVVSPGVPLDVPLLGWARRNGIPIISEVELGWCLSNAKFVAVTGTNGKSTTVSLIGHILRLASDKVAVGGNIGNPVSLVAFGLDSDWVVVTEVSSFQLDTCVSFKPKVAVLLNITPDHLDRYPNFDVYAASKGRIFANQLEHDVAIVNFDDPRCLTIAEGLKCNRRFFSTRCEVSQGAFVQDQSVVVRVANQERRVFSVKDLRIRGPHNLANSLAATLAAIEFDVDDNVIRKGISQFQGLEHRMEFVDRIDGVDFINDSKATNPDAVMFALEGMDKPTVLIAGGKDKGADFSILDPSVRAKVKAMVLIGAAKAKLRTMFKDCCQITEAADMEEAVKLAFELARPNGVVLLSPGCASFDMFDDFEHRGRVFKEIVRGLKERASEGLD